MTDIKFYLSLFWRRFPYFIIVASLIGAIGVAVAAVMPTTYRATALLIVENQEIPEDMAPSTVRAGANQQIEVIRQRLTTRSNLIDTVDRLEIYDERDGMDPDEIIADMQRRLGIRTRSSDGAMTVEVSFESQEPEQAAEIANRFAEMIEEESAQMRRGVAGGTLDFFENELARLSEEMSIRSARILDFRLENINALPGDLAYRRDRRDMLDERVRDTTREIRDMRDEREAMVETFERTGELPGARGQLSPDEAALRDARNELREALRVYSERHPRVRQLQGRVQDLQAAVGGDEGEEPRDILARMLDELDAEIAERVAEREEMEAEIERLRDAIAATPENEVRLAELERELDNVRNQYAQTQDRLTQAQMGERIEMSARGQRINILEPANVPTIPNSPSRSGVAAASVGGGVGAGLGLVVLLELLNRSIRRPAEITGRLGITPIATLPYIRTRRQIVIRRLIITAAVLVVLGVIPAAIWALHTYYLPIDLLIEQVLTQLGLAELVERML